MQLCSRTHSSQHSSQHSRRASACSHSSITAPCRALVQVTRHRNSVLVLATPSGINTGSDSDFLESVKRIGKRIQGALPIVGLLSRLASPEGGFDEVSYPEFTRAAFEQASESFRLAATELEKRHGKFATTRWMLLVLWMVKHGAGLVPSKDIQLAAKRLRVSQDIEVEMDRFEGGRQVALQKYKLIERPTARAEDSVNLAVDVLCTLCLGLKDGQRVDAADGQLLSNIIVAIIPDATDALVQQSLQGRAERATKVA